ncbi:MAG: hypothetical protein IJY15_12690 [Thermoguttaceae bacterium]|nr:hypothetical protein [Thermoguttaceae bacterium]
MPAELLALTKLFEALTPAEAPATLGERRRGKKKEKCEWQRKKAKFQHGIFSGCNEFNGRRRKKGRSIGWGN